MKISCIYSYITSSYLVTHKARGNITHDGA